MLLCTFTNSHSQVSDQEPDGPLFWKMCYSLINLEQFSKYSTILCQLYYLEINLSTRYDDRYGKY